MKKSLPDVERPEDRDTVDPYTRMVVMPNGKVTEALAKLPNPQGRPSKFNADFHPEHALKMAAEGFSLGMIATVFGVTPATLYNWRDAEPAFGAIWNQLYRDRRSAFELQALLNVKGLNKSASAHGVLAQLKPLEHDDPVAEGSEYLDPRIHKVENDSNTTNALSEIARQLAAQSGMSLMTRNVGNGGEDDDDDDDE